MANHRATKLDPPEEINGKGIPIAGKNALAIIMFTHV
jgi:hypothetical protein